MNEKRLITVSKFLSKYLRHEPHTLGLVLENGGWVGVNDLLCACQKHRFPISLLELELVVADNSKKRFAFNDDKTKIRANQGHSVDVDLNLNAVKPPDVLYHGTATRFCSAIMTEGLKRMNRHHVHLSVDKKTATIVGARHGSPVILTIDAGRMHKDGFKFFVSDNGVWLVDCVPVQYIRRE